MCTPIIGRYLVYTDKYHIAGASAQFLENVLARAVGFPNAKGELRPTNLFFPGILQLNGIISRMIVGPRELFGVPRSF